MEAIPENIEKITNSIFTEYPPTNRNVLCRALKFWLESNYVDSEKIVASIIWWMARITDGIEIPLNSDLWNDGKLVWERFKNEMDQKEEV